MWYYWKNIFILILIADSLDAKRIAQNEQVRLHEHKLLSFISKGQGYIQYENCLGSQTEITLSTTPYYDEIPYNHIEITKRQNNLFTFNHAGQIYIHSKAKGFVLIKWRNIDYARGTGYAYRFIKPTSFKIHYNLSSMQYYVSVNPLRIMLQNYRQKFQIFQMRLRVVLALRQRTLKDGLYCGKGIFMQGGITIKDSQTIFAGQQFNITISTADNLLKSFNQPKSLLVGVKAQIKLLWLKSDVIEDYRFYYRKQQLIFSKYSSGSRSAINLDL